MAGVLLANRIKVEGSSATSNVRDVTDVTDVKDRRKREEDRCEEGRRIELSGERKKKEEARKERFTNSARLAILGLTHGGDKPGFFLDTSLPNQDFSQKPGL